MERKKLRDLFLLGASLIVLYFVLLHAGAILDFADNLWYIISPFLLGGALAFVLNVPMRLVETHLLCWMERVPGAKRFKRPLAMILVLALSLALIYLLMSTIVPELINTITTIITAVPGAVRRLDQTLAPWDISVSQFLNSTFTLPTGAELNAQLENMINIALKGVAFSGAVIGSVYTNVLDFFFVIMFIIYFLSGKERLAVQIKNLMKAYLKPEKVEKKIPVRIKVRFGSNIVIGKNSDKKLKLKDKKS